MARRNPTRSIEGETNLAWRIRLEREDRGWSYETLAKLMTDAGCSINGSAIYKIEKGDPPRKISVDELIAFGRVFRKEIADLLTPKEAYQKERMKQVVKAVEEAREGFLEAVVPFVDAYFEFFQLVAEDAEAGEAALGHMFPLSREDAEAEVGVTPLFEAFSGEASLDVDQTPLREALVALLLGISEQAYLIFEAANPEIDLKEEK